MTIYKTCPWSESSPGSFPKLAENHIIFKYLQAMKASAGYIAFFSFTPLFSFLPALSPSKLKFCSIASGHRQQHCHGSEEDDSHQEARSLYGN